MSLLGKLLAVLNLAAAAGFAYLALAAYNARQTHAYAVFRFDLALDGLPVDREETDPRGRPRYRDLTDDLAKELTGNPKFLTQEDALEARRDELLQRIDAEKTKAAQAQRFATALLPLAPTRTRREELLAIQGGQLDKDPQKNAVALTTKEPQLRSEFLGLFNRVKAEKNREARRQEIARVLVALMDVGRPERGLVVGAAANGFSLRRLSDGSLRSFAVDRTTQFSGVAKVTDLKPNSFVRVTPGDANDNLAARVENAAKAPDPVADPVFLHTLGVIGARQMASALDAEARQLAVLIDQAVAARNADRRAFVEDHQYWIARLLEWEHKLRDQQDLLALFTAQAKEAEALAEHQEGKVAKFQAELKAAQDKTGQQLDRLAQQQRKLFDVRVKLRDANRINQEMEQEVRRLEKLRKPR